MLTLSVGLEKHVTRFRQISGDLIAPTTERLAISAVELADVASDQAHGDHAAALGGRLDQLASWVKDVESEFTPDKLVHQKVS